MRELFKKEVTVLGVERFMTLLDMGGNESIGILFDSEECTDVKRGDVIIGEKDE